MGNGAAMIRLLAPYALGAALLAGVWLHGHRSGRLAAEAAQAAALARAQAETMKAAEMASRYAAEARAAIEAQARQDDQDLIEGEGGDAPLSDYLRGAAGRLWP